MEKKSVVALFVIVSLCLGTFMFPIGAASTTLFNAAGASTPSSNDDKVSMAQRNLAATSVFEPVKNYTTGELKAMVDKSEPIRYYVSSKVAVNPELIRNGSIDTSKLKADYVFISANRTMIEYNVTDYFLGFNNNSEVKTKDIEDTGTFTTAATESGNLLIEASGPDYWDRSSTLLITITVTNFGWTTYSYAGYAKAYVMDVHLGTWYTEASGSSYTTFTLAPRRSTQITVLVDTESTTSVGLKKIEAGLNFGWYEILDDAGYNFVQRFSRYEYWAYGPTTVSVHEDVFELSDQFHFNETSVIKKAGEAADNVGSYIDTSYEAAIQVLHWVHDHFTYDSGDIPGTDLTFVDVTAADLFTLNHVFSDGKYHGTCDEYATLYVSFMRALNVPSRYLEWTKAGSDAHAFAEVWVTKPSGTGYFWMHADPTWNVYDNPSVYSNLQAVAVWQGGNDTRCDVDGPNNDLLLANMADFLNAYPDKAYSDFKYGFKYTGPNDYPIE